MAVNHSLEVLGQKLKLTYLHAPGEADDGVTLGVPLAMLNQIPANRCEWLVPGLLEEKVHALLRTVPQKHRHRLQPMVDSAADFMARFEAGEFDTDEPLIRMLQRFVEERVSLKLPMESFRPENLNPHCFMNFRVQDEHGRILGQSRNLAELRTKYRDQVAARFQSARIVPAAEAPAPKKGAAEAKKAEPPKAPGAPNAAEPRLAGFTGWTFGPLPELLEVKVAGRDIIGFPALHDDGSSVSLRPYRVIDRTHSQVDTTRSPDVLEAGVLDADQRIATLAGADAGVSLAFAPQEFTAFLGWMEGGLPGRRVG